jgi:hypothetical protein
MFSTSARFFALGERDLGSSCCGYLAAKTASLLKCIDPRPSGNRSTQATCFSPLRIVESSCIAQQIAVPDCRPNTRATQLYRATPISRHSLQSVPSFRKFCEGTADKSGLDRNSADRATDRPRSAAALHVRTGTRAWPSWPGSRATTYLPNVFT